MNDDCRNLFVFKSQESKGILSAKCDQSKRFHFLYATPTGTRKFQHPATKQTASEPNPFRPKKTPLERKGSHYGTLVVVRHTKQRNRYMDDLALQVSNAVMAASDPPTLLWQRVIRQMRLPSLFATLKRRSLRICNLLLHKK